jgi:hypothetical protein
MNLREKIRDCGSRDHEGFAEYIYPECFGTGGGCRDEASTSSSSHTLKHFRDWCRPKPHLSSGFSSRKSAFATSRRVHTIPENALEQEFQGELNEPWIAQLAARNSETRVVRCAASGIWWAKLDPIKRIEEFRPEL